MQSNIQYSQFGMVDLQSRNLSTMRGTMNMEDSSFEIQETRSGSRLMSAIFFKFIRPCIAEFFATMFFVFVDVCSIGSYSPGFTHGFILFVLVAATAGVSGGHINPAVTLALTICRGLQPILAPLYVLAQLLGAIIGAALAKAVMTSTTYNNIIGGVHKIGDGIDPGQAILAEMIATSILVLAVLMVAFDERNKSVLGPLAIGLSVAGGIFAIGQISGASMNPARSFGPAVVKGYWKKHYVYWVGPVLGSVFSALLYSLVLGTPNKLWIPCHEPQLD